MLNMNDAQNNQQGSQPFSTGWVVASVLIFTAMEIGIALVLFPAVIAAHLASQMVQIRLQMIMHLGSFYLGGIFVGVISPRVRLVEPAVGAFIAVLLVFLMSVFLPQSYLHFDLTKIFVGGGIAFALAIAGAYTGEKWMGNVENEDSKRAQLRDKLWGDSGVLSRGDTRYLQR